MKTKLLLSTVFLGLSASIGLADDPKPIADEVARFNHIVSDVKAVAERMSSAGVVGGTYCVPVMKTKWQGLVTPTNICENPSFPSLTDQSFAPAISKFQDFDSFFDPGTRAGLILMSNSQFWFWFEDQSFNSHKYYLAALGAIRGKFRQALHEYRQLTRRFKTELLSKGYSNSQIEEIVREYKDDVEAYCLAAEAGGYDVNLLQLSAKGEQGQIIKQSLLTAADCVGLR